MRYWVYKDAQILGPLERDQLAESVGLRGDTLVCGEDASGGREGDWRCAEEIPELSGHYLASRGVPGADMPFEEFGLLERLQFEAVGGEPENSWLGSLFEPPSVDPGPKPQSSGLLAELKASQDRVRELTEQLVGMQKKLEGLEAAGRQPKPAAGPAPFSPVAAPPPAKKAPTPEAFKLPDLPPLPSFAPPEPSAAPELPAAPAPVPEAAAPAPPPEAPPAAEPPAPPAEPEDPNKLKLNLPEKQKLQLGPTKTFKTAKKTPPPAAAAIPPAPTSPPPALQPPPAVETPAASIPPLTAPPMPTLAPPPMPTLAPPPMPTLTPTPAAAPPPMPTLAPPPAPLPTPSAAPPATLVFSTPSAAPTPGLEPPPIPNLAGPTRPLPPDTAPPMAPPATIPPSAGKGAPNTKEVLARLAKPQAAAAGPTKPPLPKARSQKTFFIVAGVGVAALALIGWFVLFRNPKEVKTAVSMEPEVPVGQEVAAAPPPQAAPVPQAPPQAPAPQPEPQPQPAPAPAVQDLRPKAIELVSTYPLDGDRGTVGQWLQFSYAASQGNTEKWDAGAVEESTYLVQYTVQSTGQKLREAITYLFEADLARGTVRAKNDLARKLMAGGAPAAPKKAAAKRKPRAAVRRADAPAAAPKALPQLPLPSDAELLPPSEDDGSFSGETVQPGL